MEINGLALKTVSSQVNSIIETEPFEKAFQVIRKDSLVVAYLVNKVIIGRFQPPGFVFKDNNDFLPQYVLKMRIFNENEELFLWRQQGVLRGRHRIDNGGTSTTVIDARQVLFGTEADTRDSWTILTEDRGTIIELPFTDLSVDIHKNRIFIRTRNYVNFNDLGQATYVDCRFLGFADSAHNLE
ncbi:MAG: CRISPR-associated protein Csx19 [Candidatus Xenobiia bacterium LiM19]